MWSLRTFIVFASILAVFSFSNGPVAAIEVQATSSLNTEEQYEETVTVPIDTIIRGENGEELELTDMTVGDGEYRVKVVSRNQRSEHPNTDIIVRSNGTEVTILDVESEKFKESEAEGTLHVTDGEVSIFVRLGDDKVFSGGVDVILTRIVPEPEPEPEPEEEGKVLPEDAGKGEAAPEVMPETGAAGAIGFFSGMSSLGYAAHRIISRRR